MILHIVLDEKFTDMAWDTFELASPRNNKFILFSNEQRLKFIKRTPVEILPIDQATDGLFLNSLNSYEFVVIHWMDSIKAKIIERASTSIKFVWVGWGGDYYHLITAPINLLKSKTAILWPPKKDNALKTIARKILGRTPNYENVLKRVDFFAPVLREDYVLLKNASKISIPPFISWTYGNLEDHCLQGINKQNITGSNILLGNSATAENNHLDAIELLKDLPLGDRDIIVPLSYGDEQYGEYIAQEGRRHFGERFRVLTNFMPMEEYFTTIQSCELVIMNHLRQQALGNIVTALFLGAKVFLNKENPIFSFFRSRGAYLFTMDELAAHFSDAPKLSEEQILANRRILTDHWGRSVAIARTTKFIEDVKAGVTRE